LRRRGFGRAALNGLGLERGKQLERMLKYRRAVFCDKYAANEPAILQTGAARAKQDRRFSRP